MALKVIGAGFGRTGTLSLKSALVALGFVKTHHMENVMTNSQQIDLWHEIASGKPPQWDAVYNGYQAAVDFPSSAYYKELLAHYPDARVVLTVRDFDSWYRSAASTIHAVGGAFPGWFKTLVPRFGKVFEMVDLAIWQGLFGGRFEDKDHARKVFEQHIEAVKAHVPANQLLVYQVKEGWQPLCDFLGCDVPSEAFPHVNDTAAFHSRLRALRVLRWLPAVLGILLVLALVSFS